MTAVEQVTLKESLSTISIFFLERSLFVLDGSLFLLASAASLQGPYKNPPQTINLDLLPFHMPCFLLMVLGGS